MLLLWLETTPLLLFMIFTVFKFELKFELKLIEVLKECL